MKRIYFKNYGQDLQFLTIDEETGKIIDVSPLCSSVVANIYIGNVVEVDAVEIGVRLRIKDASNGGKVFQTKWEVSEVEDI